MQRPDYTNRRTASAAGLCVLFAVGLYFAFAVSEYSHRRVIERELELARISVSPIDGATSEFESRHSMFTTDRYVCIPGVNLEVSAAGVGINSSQSAEELLFRLGRISRIRSLWMSLSPDFYGETEFWTPEVLRHILSACADLESLSLTGSQADDTVINSLPNTCPSIKTLRIGWTKLNGRGHRSPGCPAADAISPVGLAKINLLPKLEVLDCRGIALGGESVRGISQSQSIQFLNVAGCGLGVEAIEQLLKMQRLKLIVISEFVQVTHRTPSSSNENIGTDDSLSDAMESRKGEFPSTIIITTDDWFKSSDSSGEMPHRDEWHRNRWMHLSRPNLADHTN